MVLQQQKIVNKKKSPLHPIFRIIFDHWKFFMLASDISRIWTKSMKLLFIPTKLKYICSFSTKNVTEKYHLRPIHAGIFLLL
jgi:hypothetical protein